MDDFWRIYFDFTHGHCGRVVVEFGWFAGPARGATTSGLHRAHSRLGRARGGGGAGANGKGSGEGKREGKGEGKGEGKWGGDGKSGGKPATKE